MTVRINAIFINRVEDKNGSDGILWLFLKIIISRIARTALRISVAIDEELSTENAPKHPQSSTSWNR